MMQKQELEARKRRDEEARKLAERQVCWLNQCIVRVFRKRQ